MKWSLLFIRALFVAVVTFSVVTNAVAQGTQIQGPRDAADVYSGVVYGPIDQSDTLWAISSQYRKNQQFTVYQVMMAIYELNPRAFVNRNFNTMVSGSMLQLPTDRYIARVDAQRARAKAEQDDRSFSRSTGRQAATAGASVDSAAPITNLKPDVPLVNKEELDATEKQFQQQINALKRQQANTVNDFKQQLGQSIQATQQIVDENTLVLDELAKKNEEIEALKTELTNDFQNKLDAQARQIEELRQFVDSAKMKEQQDDENSVLNIIREPIFIIIATTVAFFLVFVLVAMLLLRKPAENKAKTEVIEEESSEKIVLDDPASNDADELLAMLESENVSDDDLLDDILSDELEESIDEVAVGTDDFGELEDEMLVPDQKDNQMQDDLDNALLDLDDDDISLTDDELDAGELDASELDVDLDSIDLGDDDIDLSGDDDVIDLDGGDELDSTDDLDVLDSEPEEVDIDSILDEQSVDISQVTADAGMQLDQDDDAAIDDMPENLTESAVVEEDEQSEISIDDLLEQNSLDSDTPQGISLDKSGEIDENVIEQIEAEISEKNIEINTLSDNFKEELENNDFDEDDLDLDDLDNDELNANSKAPEAQKSIQPLDDITKGIEDDIADAIANAEDESLQEEGIDDLDDPLTDELLNELGAELPDDELDSDVEELLSQPLDENTDGDNTDIDIDSVLEDSLNELQTGSIDFEQNEELNATDDELSNDDGLSVEDALRFDEPEDIDIDSVLDDSLDDLINNQLEDEGSDTESHLPEPAPEQEPTPEPTPELAPEPALAPEVESPLALDSETSAEALEQDESDTELDLAIAGQADIDHESEIDFELASDDDELDSASTDLEEGVADDLIANVEGSDDLHEELDDVSDDMLSELDSTDVPDEVELDDIDLGDLADLDEADLPAVEPEPSDSAAASLVLDDIPSFAGDSGVPDAPENSEPVLEEATDDGLLDLPDLDDWLDEDESTASDDISKELEQYNESESEDDVLREIEEADFDSLLEEMGQLSDDQTAAEIDKLAVDDNEEISLDSQQSELDNESLDNPDLDLTALFDESASTESSDFIDVDSLLQESENLTPASDDELKLDLEMSLDNFLNDEAEVDVDIDADQASNLDLARVYIDMEDNEAAIEALENVMKKGTSDQKEEAQALLEQLRG